MSGVEGSGSITPEQKAIYQQEFKRGVNLFRQSLAEYQNSDGTKKQLFKDVMDKAMQVMNETARAALSKAAQEQESKLEEDYQNYISNESPETKKQLQDDLDRLQKKLR